MCLEYSSPAPELLGKTFWGRGGVPPVRLHDPSSYLHMWKRDHLRGADEEGEGRCAGSGGEPVTFSIALQSGVRSLCRSRKNNSAYVQVWLGDAGSCMSDGSRWQQLHADMAVGPDAGCVMPCHCTLLAFFTHKKDNVALCWCAIWWSPWPPVLGTSSRVFQFC